MRASFGLVVVLLWGIVFAAPALAYEKAPVRDIFYEGTIILDPEGSRTVEDVLAEVRNTRAQPRQRVTAGGNAYWLVETIGNPGDVPTWWVEVFAARSDFVDLFVVADGAVEQHILGGLMRQATEERILKGMGSHVLPFTLPAGEERTLALRVQSRSLINYSIKAGPDYALNNARVYRHFFVYSLMGGMLFLILYNLFLGAALRELDYLLYAGHGISYFLFFFNSYGFAATLLGWTAHPWITVFSGFFLQIFGLAFVWRFLRVREWSRGLSWAMVGCMVLLSAGVIATPFVGYLVMAEIWMVSYALVPFLVLAAATVGIAKGVRQSLYILIGWTPMVVMTMIAIVAMLGFLERPPSGAAINASVALEMLVLSLALADRVRRLRSERERAIAEGKEKSTFLALLSHEIRTPLNGIMGTIELLGKTRLKDAQRRHVDNLQNAGNALMSLLNDVLQLAKSEAGGAELHRDRVDLLEVTKSMCDLMSARAEEKGLSLSLRTIGDIPKYVEADEARLRQVLLNLIGNAVKFTEEGEVLVCLTGRPAQGDRRVAVTFEVRDTGIGIHPRDTERLFHPFVQLDGPASEINSGTGLGLSICQEVVKALGGILAVDSRLGKGSRFHFTLEFPRLAHPSDASAELEENVSAPVAPDGTRILIVDDVDLNRNVLKELLLHFGYEVTVASSGKEALRCAEAQRFDAIITDIFMPGMDGPDLVRRLRKRRTQTRIIGLTAALDDALLQRCLAVGCDLVLTKPISGETLNHHLLGMLDTPRPQIRTAAIPPAAPIFEPRYLDEYFEALGTGPALETIAGFREMAQEQWDKIASAHEAGNAGQCAQALHKLGGALSTVGLIRLGRALEEAAGQLRSGRAPALELDDLHADLDAALVTLESYVDEKSATHEESA